MAFDIFMLAFHEPNAAENWARLQALAPDARLIEGIAGLFPAHNACAMAARTPWFFLVDADNWILDGFQFEVPFEPSADEVATWAAINPINRLRYGHGGIKLFPTALFPAAAEQASGLDFTMTMARDNRYIDVPASEHRFNSTPYGTWSAAFRECVKLAYSASIGGFKKRARARRRLQLWCEVNPEAPFADWCLLGAQEGHGYGRLYCRDEPALQRINDYAWMRAVFARRHGERLKASSGAVVNSRSAPETPPGRLP